MNRFSKAVFASVVLVTASGFANAAATAIDVTAVTDQITSLNSATGPVALIGSAVLVLTVIIKSYKWIRRAM